MGRIRSHVRPSVKVKNEASILKSKIFLVIFIIGVAALLAFGQEKGQIGAGREGKEGKPILCLNQPLPCSELGRTRLLALYAKALLMQTEAQQAQVNANTAASAYNEEQKAVMLEEGQPTGTGYQIDLNAGTVKAILPTAITPASTSPAPPTTTPSPTSPKPTSPSSPPAPPPTQPPVKK